MPTTIRAVQFEASEPLNPVNDDFSTALRGRQHPLFLLEVRNSAHMTRELIQRINAIMTENGFDVTVTPSHPDGKAAASEPVASAVALAAATRGETRLVGWTQDGTLVAGNAVEAAWNVRRQTVDAARERGEIFSVWVKGKHWYPSEALKLERSALKAINNALGDADPSSKLLFLLKTHGALRGQTPADAVIDGKLDDVVRLAAEWAKT